MRQQTHVINALRAHLAELGIVAAQGREGLKQLVTIIPDEKDARLPIDAQASLTVLAAQLQELHAMIGSIEKRLVVQHRANEASKRLESIHGIGIPVKLSQPPTGPARLCGGEQILRMTAAPFCPAAPVTSP
jgi:transposase